MWSYLGVGEFLAVLAPTFAVDEDDYAVDDAAGLSQRLGDGRKQMLHLCIIKYK